MATKEQERDAAEAAYRETLLTSLPEAERRLEAALVAEVTAIGQDVKDGGLALWLEFAEIKMGMGAHDINEGPTTADYKVKIARLVPKGGK